MCHCGYYVLVGNGFSSIIHQFLDILNFDFLLQLLQNLVSHFEPLHDLHFNLGEFNGLHELLEREELRVGLAEEARLVGSFFEGEKGERLVARL